ncbi:MAG TPA: hypothetical protein VFZ23_17090 [Pyrinomonadaceae bacterium]
MLTGTTKTSDGKGAFPVGIGMGIATEAARMRERVEEFKERADGMFDDVASDAKRLAKKGRYAAQDVIDETEYRIKKAPFLSVGMTFAAGVGLGLVTGALVAVLSGACSNKSGS